MWGHSCEAMIFWGALRSPSDFSPGCLSAFSRLGCVSYNLSWVSWSSNWRHSICRASVSFWSWRRANPSEDWGITSFVDCTSCSRRSGGVTFGFLSFEAERLAACIGDPWPARSSGLWCSGSVGKESQMKSSDKWREVLVRSDFFEPMIRGETSEITKEITLSKGSTER